SSTFLCIYSISLSQYVLFTHFPYTTLFRSMIFDENGGRIVGGRLDSRDPGGSLSYVGVVNKADLGTMGNIAFNALRDLRFKSMIDRKSTRLNSSHSQISYAVFCLKKKKNFQKILQSTFLLLFLLIVIFIVNIHLSS